MKAAVGLAALWLAATMAFGGLVPAPAFVLCLTLLAKLWRDSGGKPFTRFPDAALGLTLLAVYLSTFRWHGGDDAPNSLLPFCLLRHGTLTLEPVLDPWFVGKLENFTVLHMGKHLSIYPIVPGLLALPVYIVTALSGVTITEPALHGLSKLSGALITALSAVALRRALKGRCSDDFALALCFIYGFGSWALSVSGQALWQHGPAALGVGLALWGFSRTGPRFDALAGFGLGLSVAARPDSVFFLAAGAAFVLFCDRKRFAGFALGAALPLGLLAAYWLAYTGRLRPPEADFQANIFRGFQPDAFFGLIASPTRGLLLFFPPAVFGLLGAWRSRDALTRLMAAACAGPWLLLCFYDTWVGGSTFGPRYFAVAALVLCWAMAGLEPWLAASPRGTRLWAWAAAAAMLTHAAGGYLLWPGSDQFAAEKATLWFWSLHPLANALTATGALRSLPLPVRLLIFATALAASLRAARLLEKSPR
ncbi:MAG: hypothetical protein COV48_11205 [Elusimicrobia bacterium CG11_big_fil_rev_8_21_14_0_20_64_6]|nr:MAG: hypothetical protein COV48_11205 [Elusimicrobia bacterium CG11_big_fil_rev_8_21_14_0_20_64_6]